LAVEIIPGKQENTAISAPNLPRERELNLLHAQRCSFLIMENCCGHLAVEIISGKHCDFSTYLAKRARAQSGVCAKRCIFPIMEQSCGPLAVENFFPGKQECTAISATILPRERELSHEKAHRCSFLINEQCCGPLAAKMVPGKP
jgi:hypothetical protein